jgi:hypothetical protein
MFSRVNLTISRLILVRGRYGVIPSGKFGCSSSFSSSGSSIKNSSWEGNGGESGGEKSSTNDCKLAFKSASILLATPNLQRSNQFQKDEIKPRPTFFSNFRSRFTWIHVTIRPSLIFNGNESEAVRDRHASLQWAVLLFNVFLDCSAHETLEKYLSKKFQLTKNSRVPTISFGKLKVILLAL